MVKNKHTGQVFALEVYMRQTLTTKKNGGIVYSNSLQVENANDFQEKTAKNEYSRYLKCSQPNIMKCFGFTIDQDGNWCLLLEYAARGDLDSYYKQFTTKNIFGHIDFGAFKLSMRYKLVD